MEEGGDGVGCRVWSCECECEPEDEKGKCFQECWAVHGGRIAGADWEGRKDERMVERVDVNNRLNAR